MTDQEAASRPRLLVVEDNRDTRKLFEYLLRTDHDLDLAAGVAPALDCARRQRYDLVLLDINLKEELSGEDLLRMLRERPEYALVPIVAVTAYAQDGDREHYLSSGFDAYLGKPFTKQQLLDLVREMLHTRRSPLAPDAG